MRQLTEEQLIELTHKAQDARDKALLEGEKDTMIKMQGVVNTLMWLKSDNFSTELWLEVGDD